MCNSAQNVKTGIIKTKKPLVKHKTVTGFTIQLAWIGFRLLQLRTCQNLRQIREISGKVKNFTDSLKQMNSKL